MHLAILVSLLIFHIMIEYFAYFARSLLGFAVCQVQCVAVCVNFTRLRLIEKKNFTC
jgi:hypothetical protein